GPLIGANVAVGIDLPRIDRDQLAVQPMRRGSGDRRLPAGRGTHDSDDTLQLQGRLNNRLNWSSGRISVVGRPCGQLIGSSVAASARSTSRAVSGVSGSPKR